MSEAARFSIVRGEGGSTLVLQGDWTAVGLGRAGARLAAAAKPQIALGLDLARLGRFDTAGAKALLQSGAVSPDAPEIATRPDVRALLHLVAGVPVTTQAARRAADAREPVLVRTGRAMELFWLELYCTLVFYGALISALGRLARDPRRLRWAPCVSLMERAGLDAIPIVMVTTFFVGATIAFLGEDLLTQFGAQIFSVELVGIGVLREFGVLVTAIIIAGRSASSFAAEIGAMKMNQEVDAMSVMGVDPFDALVIPRFVALVAMMPLLTFTAMVAGLAGGLVVVWGVVGLSPAFFLERLLDNVGISQFYLGIVKAPVMAMIIAAIGCRQGLEVGGDVEQLGRRVTTAVVQALFAIIIVDAVFAVVFMAVGQ